MSDYTITAKVPQPRRKRFAFKVAGLPLDKLAIGESFLVEADKLPKGKRGRFVIEGAVQRVHMAARRMGIQVRVERRMMDKHQEEGMRVWRKK